MSISGCQWKRLQVLLLLLLLVSCTTSMDQRSPAQAHVMVSGNVWGKSTCQIGVVEGSSAFKLSDLQDLGISTYRIYGGLSRWNPFDPSALEMVPTPEQLQADPNLIDWSRWDAVMTNPPGGSDYSWVPGTQRWQGNARTLFGNLKSAGIKPLLVLRNRDDNNQPGWSADPPRTTTDWKLWWAYTFSLVYWLNVRNAYDVQDFEIHNEPDNSAQGWHGTQQDYLTFAWYTANAIAYVYKTYLPGHAYHIYGPATASDSQWPAALLKTFPYPFERVAVHDYDGDISSYVRQVHQWMRQSGHGRDQLWLTEWGSYSTPTPYTSFPFGISLLNNLIRASQPGDDALAGSTLFSLYDFGTQPLGLIDYMGQRRVDYYALRMGIRALQGCRPTYQSRSDNTHLLALTTRDAQHNLYLLLTNRDQQSYTVNVDLSQLLRKAQGTLWQFDKDSLDLAIGHPALQDGTILLKLPAMSAQLLKLTP